MREWRSILFRLFFVYVIFVCKNLNVDIFRYLLMTCTSVEMGGRICAVRFDRRAFGSVTTAVEVLFVPRLRQGDIVGEIYDLCLSYYVRSPL